MPNGYVLQIFRITKKVDWQNHANAIVLMYKICVHFSGQWMTILVLSHYFIVET